ncbi:MAG: tetratricopeptide repeat protein [Kofleriaceae bacterium]|jgi:tetratricopeptide (TPR) repeat protein|nr:tetratricopeptide repeat protein [Kofleriaceae bacterium]MBP6840937.1 tetratricopeptide repeat protein [Kofleriaceae bacterium]
MDRTWDATDHSLPAAGTPSSLAVPVVGATIGHFVVRAVLGQGGMGTVVEGYDPDLDRAVAIKVVRDRAAGSAAGRRLVREAQAMARLTHPNVATVYEVGTIDRQVYLVMEKLDGGTLGDWLGTARPWRRVLEVFRQAGEGLAAAHAAGLVHRDFKPSNVLMDGSDRPRVTDFGIAKLAGEGDDLSAADRSMLVSTMTMAGAVVGTPAYMAPEQRRGGAVDARADQYSFCVALHEALLGSRPGERDGDAPRAHGTPALDVARVPARVRAALQRGLAVEPEARFPSMRPLLDVLAAAIRPRRRWIAAAAAVAVTLGAVGTVGGAMWAQRDLGLRTCQAGASLADRLWSDPIRSQLARAFAGTGRIHAEPTIRVVDRSLVELAASWRLARRAACTVERDNRQARMACLDGQLARARAQLDVWFSADAEVVDRAVAAASSLPRPEECASAASLGSSAPREAAPLIGRVQQAEANRVGGRLAQAQAILDDVVPQLEARADGPAVFGALTEALIARAELALDLGDPDGAHGYAVRATKAAGKSADDRAVIRALLTQASASTAAGQPGEALGVLAAAEAVVDRTGLTDFRADLERYRGIATMNSGDVVGAIPMLERAVAALEQRDDQRGRGRIQLANGLYMIGWALHQASQSARALPYLERALALERPVYPADHPELAATLHGVGVVQMALGRLDQAAATLAECERMMLASLGPDHVNIARLATTLGNLAHYRGDSVTAMAHHQRAIDKTRAALGPHTDLAAILTNQAQIQRDLDLYDKALPNLREAIEIYDRAGVTSETVAQALTVLGQSLFETGRPAEARGPLERALAVFTKAQVGRVWQAEARASLAEVLWALGERTVAVAVGREALADATSEVVGGPAGANQDGLRRYIEDWLAGHRVAAGAPGAR